MVGEDGGGDLTFVINHGADAAELRLEGTDVFTGAAASGLKLHVPLPRKSPAVPPQSSRPASRTRAKRTGPRAPVTCAGASP